MSGSHASKHLARPVRGHADIRVAVHPQHRVAVPLAQPGEQLARAELAIAMDGQADPLGQHRQRRREQRLLIGQAAFAAMVQGALGQRDGAAPEADADHQEIMPIVQQDPVDEELHLLAFQSRQRRAHQRLIVIGLRNPVVVQEAPQPLLLGVLGGIERHGAGNLAKLGRDTLRDADHHQGQCVELTYPAR